MKRCALSFGLNFLRVCVLLMLLVGCSGEKLKPPAETSPRINPPVELPAALAAWPEIAGRHPDVPKNYNAIAESRYLRLYLDQKTSALIVEDMRNGRLWYSAPADLAQVKTSQAWKRRIESPVLLSYTDADRGRANVADVKDAAPPVFAPVEGGVRATYQFPKVGFTCSVIYTVRDDYLEVTVPEADIVEPEDLPNTLVSLDVMLFLGATHDGEDGYIVFPDGSGALMTFTSPHPPDVQEISLPLYGPEQVSFRDPGTNYQESLPMPIFGLVSGDAAFMALITQGDFDAKISVGRSGKTIPYNHVWATLIYRRQGQFSLTGGQPTWLFEPNLVGGDRQVRYYFLTRDEASYVGMASRYRRFLIEERGARRLPDDAPLMALDFFMGVERRTWFLRDLIKMTSFEDVRAILADLESEGVTRLDVSLTGWNKGGAQARYPQRLPVDPRWGGEEALRQLAADLHTRGQRLFLTDNYILALPEGKGAFLYTDAMRGVDGLPVRWGWSLFVLNPQVAMRKFAVRDIPKMADFGVDGLRLEYFAALAAPDTNDRYPLPREGFAATWMQIAGMVREEFGAAAMTGGNSYAIPHADRLDGVALDSTHYDLFDATIPLYPIATHGLVSYSGQPFNLLNDGQRTFLRQIEYGATPHFLLTKENSALLTRTSANDIWSGEYTFWRDEVIRQYKAMEELAPLVNQFIIGHEQLADGVYRVTYEDGTSVIVNYSERPYTSENVAVPALDFAVLAPGR